MEDLIPLYPMTSFFPLIISCSLKVLPWFKQVIFALWNYLWLWLGWVHQLLSAAAMLCKSMWHHNGSEKFHCSISVSLRSRLESWWGCASCLQQRSWRTHVYITAHFFSSGAAFPSAFSISKMIRLKTSTAVCSQQKM